MCTCFGEGSRGVESEFSLACKTADASVPLTQAFPTSLWGSYEGMLSENAKGFIRELWHF